VGCYKAFLDSTVFSALLACNSSDAEGSLKTVGEFLGHENILLGMHINARSSVSCIAWTNELCLGTHGISKRH
jgi:hypothetical protein